VSFAEGQTIAGRYVLRRLLGAGGMGAVWIAEDTRLRTEVALKFVLPQVNGAEIVERFRREAQIVAQIRSPNVVQIIDVGIDELGRDYLAMELLVGEDFGSMLSRRERIPLEEAVPIVLQAARGLARAHSQNVVHRDVKPDNIFLCSDEMGMTVKVLDFGIAKGGPSTAQSNLTSMGTIIGTPDYMAPEQVMNEGPCTPATDLYALAAVLYRAITGVIPFSGRSMTEQLVRITADPLRPPSSLNPAIGPNIDAWFEVALAKTPTSRPPSARHFVDSLLAATGDPTASARLSSPSWSDQSRPSAVPGFSGAPPSSGQPPVVVVGKPTTTKSITLDNLHADNVKIPVASRAWMFVVAALGGLVVAGGLLLLYVRDRVVKELNNAAQTSLPSLSASALADPDPPPLPPATPVPPVAGSAAAIVPRVTPAITSATATPKGKGVPPAKTAKGKEPPPAGTQTKKTNEPDFY